MAKSLLMNIVVMFPVSWWMCFDLLLSCKLIEIIVGKL